MKFLICGFCVCVFLNCVQANCGTYGPKPTLQRLREMLICGYDKTERPAETKLNQTKVYVLFIPKYIEFDDSKDVIRLSTLIYMRWYDPNLVWRKSDYDNIVYAQLEAEDIWLPDFEISDSKLIDGKLNTQGQSTMLVKPEGIVHYVTPSLIHVYCTAQWVDWPFDKHVCNITISSPTYFGHELDLHYGYIAVRMNRFTHSHEWELLKYESLRDVEDISSEKNMTIVQYYVFMTLRLTIQRQSAVLVASFIGPAIALAAFSLVLLYIEPTHSERLKIIGLMLAVQCLYLQYLAYKIPSNGDKTPKIVKFFASNLFLTGVLLVETLVVGLMPTWTSNPSWLQTVFRVISSNSILKLLLPDITSKKFVNSTDPNNEDGTVPFSNDEPRQQWKMFATLIDRFIFLSTVNFLCNIYWFVFCSISIL